MTDTRGNRTADHKGSGWKWAFLILLLLNIGVIIWLGIQLNAFSNNEEVQPESEEFVISGDTLEFELVTDKQQVNRVINLYLQEELDERFSGYTVIFDELVELEGALNVFGFDVDFGLYMEPLVMDNGNLQLRAQSIQLGSFDLPIGIALNILSQQMELPEWIKIDSEQEYILVAFSEFALENDMQFKMRKVDLEADDIRLDILLPEEAIK
ncbi:YpmS family protein [Alkalibacterium sp. f15]|uniref:YpmS family protein n=1 Tax=Alkalibacterium sp. f15 TaxID=3414029 RepID=UPI003BF7A560